MSLISIIKNITVNQNQYRTLVLILCSSFLLPTNTWAAKGKVTEIISHRESNSSLNYNANYNNYTWQGNDLIIDGFKYNGTTYDYTVKADKVVVRRAGNTVTSGERCALFSEATSQGSNTLRPSYPRLNSSNNCDLAEMMGGNVINRGVLDLFNNGGGYSPRTETAKNVERVDFIFSGGVTTPLDATELSQTGVVATEKSGNNDVLVAAILSLDSSGNPASYGPAVRIYRNWASESNKYAYGLTNIGYPITFMANELNPPQNYPYNVGSSWETLGMVFVDVEALGLGAGQTWYGFSYFSPDIGNNSPNAKGQIAWNAGIDPVNYNGFPQDTDASYDYGDADVYGGVGGYFFKNSLSNIHGTAYQDDNSNGTLDATETGVANIKVTLYRDNNNNGSLQAGDTELASVDSNITGQYSFIGIPNGKYLVVIDKNDADTPLTHRLNGSDTISITINNADSNDNNYPYIPEDLSTLVIRKTASVPSSVSTPGLKLSTYQHYGNHPNNHNEFVALLNSTAIPSKLYGTGTVGTINNSGNPYGSNDNYLSIFEGYLKVDSAGTYNFAVDGDDAVEVIIDDQLIASWYGGHGNCYCQDHNGSISLSKGIHTIKFHQEERGGGDNYYLYWKKPSDSSYSIVPNSNLYVDFSSGDNVSSGDQITYTITVTNFGDVAATGFKVTDKLSSDVTYISDDSGGSYNPTTGVWTLGTIPQGGSKVLNIVVSVKQSMQVT